MMDVTEGMAIVEQMRSILNNMEAFLQRGTKREVLKNMAELQAKIKELKKFI